MLWHLRTFVGPLLPGRSAGAVGLAVLASLLALRAVAAPAPAPKPDKKDAAKKEEPKNDEPKKAQDTGTGDVEDPLVPRSMLENMIRSGMDPEQARRQVETMKRMMRESRQRGRLVVPLFLGPNGLAGEGRLGVYAEKPSATLAEQLDLPGGQGVVVGQVQPDSPAAKAGLKAHDILLELDGKAVPDDPYQFARQVGEVKADTAVAVVVLRKGKRETIKGLKLPEADAGLPNVANLVVPLPALPAMPAMPVMPVMPAMLVPGGGAGGVLLTTFRTGDRFTTRYQEGTLVLTVTGTVADGKAKLGEIQVQDGGPADKYESADKVPEQYRDKVKNLIETSEKSSVKIEIKSP